MIEQADPLWDPEQPGDETLERLSSLLGRYRHVPAAGHAWAAVPSVVPYRRRRRALLAAAVALAACVATVAAWVPWRLHWDERRQWTVDAGAGAAPVALGVGRTLTTSADESATVRVARIGRMDVLPGTRIRLLDTRGGRHRLELLEGRVRARIWAPPGYFGIAAGASETVDLGCEFEMSRNPQGEGSIHVTSGWVMHRVNGQETLVPAGSRLDFDAARSGIPFATTSSAAFRAAVRRLDLAMAEGKRLPDVERAVVREASQADRFALLSLLTRYPALASGPVYPKLATLLDMPVDAPHRDAWSRGSMHAMDVWWERIPRPPKAWWLNWRDAF
ncbi:MAG: hypothetical protein LCH70_00180 [Proteobacteria bacterium]|nr:hypothetical protein [Pseudomonadota bacterium]